MEVGKPGRIILNKNIRSKKGMNLIPLGIKGKVIH